MSQPTISSWSDLIQRLLDVLRRERVGEETIRPRVDRGDDVFPGGGRTVGDDRQGPPDQSLANSGEEARHIVSCPVRGHEAAVEACLTERSDGRVEVGCAFDRGRLEPQAGEDRLELPLSLE